MLKHLHWLCLQVQWRMLLTTPNDEDGCGQRCNRLEVKRHGESPDIVYL